MSVNTPVRVAILGASGRMGQLITRLCCSIPSLQIVARIDLRPLADHIEPAIIDDIQKAPEFDVLIDFSLAAATISVLPEMAKRKAAWLVGTTALTQEQKESILSLAAFQPICIASNMSLGIALMQRLCAVAATVLHDWDCEILETHHHGKVDAPSGTALTLANTIADALRQCGNSPYILTARSALHEKRDPQSIGIASLRGGTVAGEHTAFWYGENERIEIKHTAESREIFANGACKVAYWLANQPAGSYTMQQFLDGILN